jgi:hypothetical protein
MFWFMQARTLFVLAAAAFFAAVTLAEDAPVDGNATIRKTDGKSVLVITTTSRVAGAIHSLTWNGKEFIDSTDHGRQLQSASNLDVDGKLFAEAFNPTEAGSRSDGAGPNSSSKLLKLNVKEDELSTLSQMAFWLKPGELSGKHAALNTESLSNHLLAKHVVIGYKQWPRVIAYDVTFTLPQDEKHTQAVFEALTGYMPAEFGKWWLLDADGKLQPDDSGKQGEQARPVAFSTSDEKWAMGVFSPDQPSKGFESVGYGRFRFVPERVVKWNCVFRLKNKDGIAPGDYKYRLFVPVGTLAEVGEMLGGLQREFAKK